MNKRHACDCTIRSGLMRLKIGKWVSSMFTGDLN
jgi:hypothetical protein